MRRMVIKHIQLWEDRPEVYMTAYLIENSTQYRQEQARPAMLVCAGGAFQYIADRESEPVALAYATEGFQTFTLHYTVKHVLPDCLLDAAKAVQTIREHAAEWGVDPGMIAIEGMSAGAYLAVALPALAETELFHNVKGLSPELIKPNAVVAGYAPIDMHLTLQNPFIDRVPEAKRERNRHIMTDLLGDAYGDTELYRATNPLLHITGKMVPVFAWCTSTDDVVPPYNTALLVAELIKAGVPVESHVFGWGPHAMSLGTVALRTQDNVDPHIAKWFDLSVEWLYRVFSYR